MTFKINEDIITYANTFLDEVTKIQKYIGVQTELYNAFTNYNGEAKKEIQEMQGHLMEQLQRLGGYYIFLSNGLIEVINKLFEQDKIAKEAYYGFVLQSLERAGVVKPGEVSVEMIEEAYSARPGGEE